MLFNETPVIYRHFKGGYYLVLGVATEEATGEHTVIYQSLKDGRVWTRPYEVFNEEVPKDKVNPTNQKLRFEKVKDFSNPLDTVSTEKLVEELLRREDCPVELQMKNTDKVWRDYFVIGKLRYDYVDRETTEPVFNFVNSADTLEEAKIKRDRYEHSSKDLVISRVIHILQDFD